MRTFSVIYTAFVVIALTSLPSIKAQTNNPDLPAFQYNLTEKPEGERAQLCDSNKGFCQTNCGGPEKAPMNFCNSTTMGWGCGCLDKVPDYLGYQWPINHAHCIGTGEACKNACEGPKVPVENKPKCNIACVESYSQVCGTPKQPPAYYNVADVNTVPTYAPPVEGANSTDGKAANGKNGNGGDSKNDGSGTNKNDASSINGVGNAAIALAIQPTSLPTMSPPSVEIIDNTKSTTTTSINNTTPEIHMDPDVSLSSDGDSSDERSFVNKTSDESAHFRPSHHHLKAPELKRSASVSSFSSYASSSPPDTPLSSTNIDANFILDKRNTLALGESGALAQNWFTSGSLKADGKWFKDEQGRICLLRGVNLCGNSKLPTKPNGSSHLNEGFFDHRNVSFVGRPFPLEEVHQHFARLRTWGLTFVRLLVTWESLEHAGPGVYDEEFIDYLINVIEQMPRYGIKCFIDPHQDCWSRFSGGSGAPGWTFEVAGLDMTKFKTTGAAYVHNMNHKPGDSLPMVWPTNYTKLASSTMFTLFWGGDVFAPNNTCEGVNVQEFLQTKYVNCYKHLASRLQHLEAVMGFELMNEPHQGYIGLADLHRYDEGKTLVFGDSPSALQSFALGDGIPQEIEVWIKSWPFPTRKDKTRLINEEHESAWLDGSCIWRQHGVWDVDAKTGKPKVLKKDYFLKHPKTGEKLEFYKDFYLPFVKRYSEGIQSVNKEYFVFVEPLPNEPPPKWTPSDHHNNVIFAPHWYDLKALFTKTFNGKITHDVQRLTRGAHHIAAATFFGISGAKKNYSGQVRNIIKNGLQYVGEKPCVIGECGIPMDINEKQAFLTNDWAHHSNFLDAVLCAMEKNLVNFTLWNYNPINDNTHGDHWYGEDFSIYSRPNNEKVITNTTTITKERKVHVVNGTREKKIKVHSLEIQTNFQDALKISSNESNEKNENTFVNSSEVNDECEIISNCTDITENCATSPTSPFDLTQVHFWEQDDGSDYEYFHQGGRVLEAVLRPYAAKIPGIPQSMNFNLKKLEFTFKFTNYPSSQQLYSIKAPETEIYIPNYHYKKLLLDIRVSDGDWRYVKSRQTLYWRVKDWKTEGVVHTLRIRVAENLIEGVEISNLGELSSNNSNNKLEDDEAKTFTIWLAGAVVVAAYLWVHSLMNVKIV
ncbi:2950_t:CDS:10 [Funneliformis geosporum]|nr:2950_t:CDS:10 [Funneliformis geosporum]